MFNYSSYVKSVLFNIIDEMSVSSDRFVKNPGKDFTRNRKLGFSAVMKLFMSMQGNSLGKELLDYFGLDKNIPTVSAFVQQRDKLLPCAFEYLFRSFSQHFKSNKLYKGYRLFACDGSDILIPRNPDDIDTYISNPKDVIGYNSLHINALYDLCNRRYVDALIQYGNNTNEYSAVTTMMDRLCCSDKSIILCDRGYECYNVFAHAFENGLKFVIRVKDINSNGITSSCHFPDCEFDERIHFNITRRHTQEIRNNRDIFKFLSSTAVFDYLGLREDRVYPMDLRVVRFKISDNTYECIVTNLEEAEFSASDIKKLYALRWGIETSFRELKYTIGLVNFHAKKVEYILQEIFARLTLYNFCEIIISNVLIIKKSTVYTYQVNFTMAIHICKKYLKHNQDISPPDVKAFIEKYTMPIRPGRHSKRVRTRNSSVYFNYRIA